VRLYQREAVNYVLWTLIFFPHNVYAYRASAVSVSSTTLYFFVLNFIGLNGVMSRALTCRVRSSLHYK